MYSLSFGNDRTTSFSFTSKRKLASVDSGAKKFLFLLIYTEDFLCGLYKLANNGLLNFAHYLVVFGSLFVDMNVLNTKNLEDTCSWTRQTFQTFDSD